MSPVEYGLTADDITVGILAGGEGRRLGGADKGWFMLDGEPLIERSIRRVADQAGRICISANRSLDRYRALGCPVHSDADIAERHGPLAGIVALLSAIDTPYLLLVPVDTPALPTDLAVRLARAMTPDAALVTAESPAGVHPLHALMRQSLWASAATARMAGVRRVTEWQQSVVVRRVIWPEDTPFLNINRPDDVAAFVASGDPSTR